MNDHYQQEVTYEGETTFEELQAGDLFREIKEDGTISARTIRVVWNRGNQGYQYLYAPQWVYFADARIQPTDRVVPVDSEDAPSPEPVKPKPLTFGDLDIGDRYRYAGSSSSAVYMKVGRSTTRHGISGFDIEKGWPISTGDSTKVERVGKDES